MEWAEKYRPKSLRDIVLKEEIKQKILDWAEKWKKGGIPEKKALVFEGRPGVGKTTTAIALANDMGWDYIELNASDIRDEKHIKEIALRGSLQQTLSIDGKYMKISEGKMKLIILDEADNLYEVRGPFGDFGGKKAILETVKLTRQPIILIVNDPYELFKGESGTQLKNYVEEIEFRALNYKQIASILYKICQLEGIKADRTVLEKLAQRSGGDVRAAINDLQLIAAGKRSIVENDLNSIGFRDNFQNIYGATLTILLTTSIKSARETIMELDEDPSLIMQWLDENLPRYYLDPNDLDRGFYYLERANVFNGRILRRQYFGYLVYVSDFISAISIAKKNKYGIHEKLKSPDFLKILSKTKSIRQTRDNIAEKLAKVMHTSTEKINPDIFELYKTIFKNDMKFEEFQIRALKMDDDEIAFLKGMNYENKEQSKRTYKSKRKKE
ncbi:MAG: replication factor C large subunit [Thermoplasmata archaeon]|jgi:replication factor C large subunit